VVAPRAPSQLQTKALWPCCGVQGWKWSEAITEVKPFSWATLLHLRRSVGWNCSNIAAYPTVPVGLPLVSMNAASLGYEKAIIAVGFELLTVPPRRKPENLTRRLIA
jgi:hypothetical protein